MTVGCIPLQYNSPFFVPADRGVSDDAKALNLFVEEMLEDCSQSVIISANEILQEPL
jgi:ABC-type sugar transport system substrate-binding protein